MVWFFFVRNFERFLSSSAAKNQTSLLVNQSKDLFTFHSPLTCKCIFFLFWTLLFRSLEDKEKRRRRRRRKKNERLFALYKKNARGKKANKQTKLSPSSSLCRIYCHWTLPFYSTIFSLPFVKVDQSKLLWNMVPYSQPMKLRICLLDWLGK